MREKNLKQAEDDCKRCSSEIKEVFPYDLVFLDLRLQPQDKDKPIEEITGIKILERIKELNPAVPVIVFTASEKALTHKKALELGADGYWIKGVSSGDELRKIIVNCLKNQYITINSKEIRLRDLWVKIKQVESKEKIYYRFYSLPSTESPFFEIKIKSLGSEHPYRAEINKYLKDSFQLLIEKSSSFVHKVIFRDANRFHHIAVNIRRIQDIRHQRPSEKKMGRY